MQAQTIYRQFGDMAGLLDAVVARGFADFLHAKDGQAARADPVDELRDGWDMHVGFAVANPAVYALMYGEPRTEVPDGARQVYDVLRGIVAKVAAAGRLAVPVDTAAGMVYAAGVGVALSTIVESNVGSTHDPSLSTRTRDAILGAITIEPPDGRAPDAAGTTAWHAISLRAALPEVPVDFTRGERALLGEWLDRIAEAGEARGT